MKPRDNPFASDRLDRLSYRFMKGDWQELLARLEGFSYRAAILGPHGSGKTALMDELAVLLDERGFGASKIFLNSGNIRNARTIINGSFREVTEKDIVFLDGADLLGRFEWRRVKQKARKAAGLIITSHTSRLLPVLIECSTSAALLDALVRELVPEDEANELGHMIQALFVKHRGNLRNALRELYDVYSSRDSLRELGRE